MHIEEREVGMVTVVDLKGKMTLGEGDEDLGHKINHLLARGRNKVVLNFAECPYIDSAGLGETWRSRIKINNHGGGLAVIGLSKRLRDLLYITKTLKSFHVFEDETEAVSHLQPDEGSMQISEREVGPVVILDLRGRLSGTDAAKSLKDRLDVLQSSGYLLIVLNFAHCAYVDTKGLLEIVRGHSSLCRIGGQLRLLHVGNGQVRQLLTKTRLLPVLPIFDDETNAVRRISVKEVPDDHS